MTGASSSKLSSSSLQALDLPFVSLPIIQAPMAGVQNSALAIAVARAGGLGSLPCAMLDAVGLERELALLASADAQMDRSSDLLGFNLNFFCHMPPEPDAEREAQWRAALAPFYEEYGIDPSSVPSGAGRVPFSQDSLNIIRPYRPAVVSFHFGLPKAEWLAEIKGWGGKVWSSATTLQETVWLQQQGADAVILQGLEAGGHRGMFLSEDLATQMSLDELLKSAQGSLTVPVIAAGGIASPEAVKTLILQGAAAVQIGTAYLQCDEASTSAIHRLWLSNPVPSAITNLMSGRPARRMINRFMSELGPISSLAPAFPLATAALAPLRAAAEQQGKADFTPLWCGTDVSGCRSVSAAEQTHWLVSGL